MALTLNKDLESGVKISYLRISRIVVDRRSGTISFTVNGYLSKEAKQEGKTPVTDYQYTVEDAQSYEIINNMNIVGALYGVLKGLPDFAEAIDA